VEGANLSSAFPQRQGSRANLRDKIGSPVGHNSDKNTLSLMVPAIAFKIQ